MMDRYFSFAAACFVAHVCIAQPAGDALFDTDQVIEMHLTFADDDHWAQLTNNYLSENGLSIPAGLSITDLTGTYQFDSVAVRLKGNSSYDFYPTSKKPMKLDLNSFMAGQDYHGLKKLNLNNCWSDPTFLREKITMDACRREGVLAPRVTFANVYLNNIHWGLYSAVEQVDRTFLERWLNDNAGNLFKAGDNYTPDGGGLGQEADLNYYGATAASYTGRYELKTNEIANDWSDLIELLDFIDNSSVTDLVAQLPERFEIDELLRSLALDNLFGNMDAYYGSARNFYVYHDSATTKWNWIHWDANMSFGRYRPDWVNDVPSLAATYTSPGRRLLQRVLSNVTLRQRYLNNYCDLFERFTNADLDPRIDALRDLIQPHVYADNNKEFSNVQFDVNIEQSLDFIPGLKSFIAERRSNLLASSLDCTSAGLAELNAVELSAFPNPTTGLVHLSLPKGFAVEDVDVLDAFGRMVPVAVDHQSVVDLTLSPNGVYLVRVRVNGAEARALVVKD